MAFSGWGKVESAQDGGKPVKVDAQDPGKPTQQMKDKKQTKDGQSFQLIRLVANLKLTQEGNTTARLNPPQKVQINLTDEDIKAAGGINKIKVAYWQAGWVGLPVTSRGKNQVAVEYDKNGDPPVAVGT